ncbi:MAG: glucosaminidase domain-containing protein [Flavisolibacter sp.]
MKKITFLLVISLLSLQSLVHAQNSAVVLQYIDTYKDIAIAEMKRTGVPASITLAQGIHETQAGTSDLVRASNNHFGIKCKADWKGETVFHDDDARAECFRKYSDPADSYVDHSDFLKTRSNYFFLFALDPTDYEAWAWGLKKAGYATNPKYPQILIKLIRDYNLQDYTLMALQDKTSDGDRAITSKKGAPSSTDTLAGIQQQGIRPKPVYPPGIFKINDTRVVYVFKGTSYLKIADDNNIPLSKLFEFNDMDAAIDIAVEDQLMYLQRKRKIGANEIHIVAKGETLFDIAQSEGIRMESLLEYNFLKKGRVLQQGVKLYLTKTEARVKEQADARNSYIRSKDSWSMNKREVGQLQLNKKLFNATN